MKLHLPRPLFRALLACLVSSAVLAGISFAESPDSVTYTTHQNGPLNISGHSAVIFENIRYESAGAVIYQDGDNSTVLRSNDSVLFSGNFGPDPDDDDYDWSWHEHIGRIIHNEGTFSLDENGEVNFRVNCSAQVVDSSDYTICNKGTFSLNGNGTVTFSDNSYHYSGGICNHNTFSLTDNRNVTFSGIAHRSIYNAPLGVYAKNSFMLCRNGDVTFCGNVDGAITNGGTFSLSDNKNVTISENPNSAIFNYSVFTMSGNEVVTFSGNTTSCTYGGAICNVGTFSLSGNGDVLFEKNADYDYNEYVLRSIYSAPDIVGTPSHSIPTLNLSASENHSITFRDSIYAEGEVNLNQDGTGDIIFTGATTEADLREVKGGSAGTAKEILKSRTSELVTNATLYGGRLIVEDCAILKGQGITVTEGANATILLNGGTLDETGYTIAVSSDSGLEFAGENTLAASSVALADNSFLSFILDEAQTAVHWNADLDIQGGLTLNLTHDDKPVHDIYALLAMQGGNTVTGWDAAALTISGTTAEHLVWENNTLYYRPMLVQENGDTTLDKDVDTDAAGGTIGGKDDVSINGNGHTLTVKNEVQLVQMALKDGIVKLEGENNGIVSVTLTEGGELVLTAGAGLKTGDIISMVASGKGELVISGDITFDNKGMKGKAGAQATVSHADAKVLGDATISNVRVEDSVIDLAEGSTVTFSHVSLAAGSRITDDPATLALDDVTAELKLGVNTAVVSVDEVLQAGSTLVQNGNETMSLTLAQDAVVMQLEATTFDSVTLTGDSLVLQLSGVETEFFNGADYIAVSFTSGTGLATFGTDVEVLLTLDEEHFVHGYYVQGSDHTSMLFATNDKAVVTPEPATATLSFLALAALAARRRRK